MSGTTSRRVGLALLAMGACVGAAAQQQATFSAPSLTPQAALRAAQAAMQHCSKAGFQVAVAVSDRAGHPLVMLRDRFAGPHTPETAMNKAYTAVSFKTDTVAFARATEAGGHASGIRHLPRVVAVGGGVPIEAAGSQVGAIGVSGAPGGDADDACARAGIEAIREDLEF